MVAAELTRLIVKMLGTPGSEEYEAAKAILSEHPTLWDALVSAGITDKVDQRFGKAEIYWVCATMPDELEAKLLQRLRVALNAGVPVVVSWVEGAFDVTFDIADHADGMHLTLTTPMPDLSKLASGYGGALQMAGAV